MLYAIIGMLVIIADQYVKFWVQGHIALNETVDFIPGILSLANVHNDGAAFGFLAGNGARIPFIILAGVFTLAVIIALATKLISGRLARWSIVLVTAGGLSNCLDRVMYGYVQDMFKTEFINFPVFNIADVFITLFAIIFALAVIFGKTRKDRDDDYEFEDEEEEEEPRRAPRKKQKRSRRAARYEDVDEEDEEEEEEEPVPVVRKPQRQKKVRRPVVVDEEEEEEEPAPAPTPVPARRTAAQQPVRQQRQPAASSRTAAGTDEDPFAAWERANAKNAAAKQSATRAATAKQPAARTAAAAPAATQPRTAAQRSAAAAAPAARTTAKPAAAPAAKPAAKPAPKPAVEEEFSLDDILNEFR